MGRGSGETGQHNRLARSGPGAIGGASGAPQGARSSIDATLPGARLPRDPSPVAANNAPPMAHTLYPAPRVGNGPTREFAAGTGTYQAFVSAVADAGDAGLRVSLDIWGQSTWAARLLRTLREPRGPRGLSVSERYRSYWSIDEVVATDVVQHLCAPHRAVERLSRRSSVPGADQGERSRFVAPPISIIKEFDRGPIRPAGR